MSVLAIQATHAQAVSRQVSTPVAIVVQLYQDYAWEVVVQTRTQRVGLMDEPPPVLRKYFDDSLSALIVRDSNCRERTKEECLLDGLPIWDSNDPEAFALEVAPSKNPGVVAVTFRRRYPQPAGTTVALSYNMVKTSRGWRVHDIIREDGSSLVKTLTGNGK